MSHKHALVAELKMEAASTRKMLEKVPAGKGDWQPHGKSMKLGKLAVHIAELPEWTVRIMSADEFDIAKMDRKPATDAAATAEALTATMDEHVNRAVSALESANDEDFDKMWTFRNGAHVVFTLPKKVALRSLAYNHWYHHRGQLSVYLRLLDIHVPGMYGPSADDAAAMAAASTAAAN